MTKKSVFRHLKECKITDDYGNDLEVRHFSGHDIIELTITGEFLGLKPGNKDEAKKLALYLLAWAEG